MYFIVLSKCSFAFTRSEVQTCLRGLSERLCARGDSGGENRVIVVQKSYWYLFGYVALQDLSIEINQQFPLFAGRQCLWCRIPWQAKSPKGRNSGCKKVQPCGVNEICREPLVHAGHPLQALPAGAVHPAVLILRVLREQQGARGHWYAIGMPLTFTVFLRKRFMFDIEKMDMPKTQSVASGAELVMLGMPGMCDWCLRNKLNSKMEFPLILDLEALPAWFGFLSLVAWVLKILLVPVVKSLDQLTHRWFLATLLYHSCEPGLFQRERQVHAAHCKGLAELHLCTLLGEDETFETSWVFSGHCSQWRCQQWSLLHLRPFATRGYPARRLWSRSFQGNLVQLGFSCRWRQVSVDQVWRRSLARDTCGVVKLCDFSR